MSVKMGATGGVRVAVEGCGHGTLDSIYASIQQACRVKGWDGVDVLIIGGDFQVCQATDATLARLSTDALRQCATHPT